MSARTSLVVCDSWSAFVVGGFRREGGWRAFRGLRAVGGRIILLPFVCGVFLAAFFASNGVERVLLRQGLWFCFARGTMGVNGQPIMQFVLS